MSRQLVCPFVEFPVRETLLAEYYRGGFRRRRGLLLEQLMDGFLFPIDGRSGAPSFEQ